jgi:hypothetical protein
VKDVASRPEGHYVGHSHIVSEYVGGQLTRLHIDFKPPETILDTSRFQVQREAFGTTTRFSVCCDAVLAVLLCLSRYVCIDYVSYDIWVADLERYV